MQVRAKFKVDSITKHNGGNEEVRLSPVYGKDGTANAAWSKYTPQGSVSLTITQDGAQGRFEPGKEYFIDFSEAPPEG